MLAATSGDAHESGLGSRSGRLPADRPRVTNRARAPISPRNNPVTIQGSRVAPVNARTRMIDVTVSTIEPKSNKSSVSEHRYGFPTGQSDSCDPWPATSDSEAATSSTASPLQRARESRRWRSWTHPATCDEPPVVDADRSGRSSRCRLRRRRGTRTSRLARHRWAMKRWRAARGLRFPRLHHLLAHGI